jgi:hypothetical protein
VLQLPKGGGCVGTLVPEGIQESYTKADDAVVGKQVLYIGPSTNAIGAA